MLDALVDAQRRLDPTLAFRYACRVGMCGSCAMVIDGRERWACRTLLAQPGERAGDRAPALSLPADPRPRRGHGAVQGEDGRGGRGLRPRRGAGRVRASRRRQPRAPAHRWGHRVHRLRHVRLGLHHGRPRSALRRARRVQPGVHAPGGQPRRRACGAAGAPPRRKTRSSAATVRAIAPTVCPMEISPTDSILALRRRAVSRLLG